MNTTGKGFGKRLKKLRVAAGLTQAALGKMVGVNPVSIAQYESGAHAPREKTAEKLMAFCEGKPGKASSADAPTPKKQGRPKKDQEKKPTKARKRRQRAEEPGELTKQAETKAVSSASAKSPARLGLVSRAWMDQQIESFCRNRGHIFQDGPFRVVIMRGSDVFELCTLMLNVGAVKVE